MDVHAGAHAREDAGELGREGEAEEQAGDRVDEVERQPRPPATASKAAGVWEAPMVQVYTFMISFASRAASAQASASGTRPRRLPVSRPRAAPASPTSPQAAICQGV